MSLAMIVKITIESLYKLIHRGNRPDLFDNSDILMIPIVNLDGYLYINSRYNTTDWVLARMKRKNFNLHGTCS